jgi:hypothetical protein
LQGLDEAIDKAEVITQLVVDGQDNLAQQWVTTLGRDYQVRGGIIMQHWHVVLQWPFLDSGLILAAAVAAAAAAAAACACSSLQPH